MKKFRLLMIAGLFLCFLNACKEKPVMPQANQIDSSRFIPLTQYAYISDEYENFLKEACQLADFGQVDTAHGVSVTTYNILQERFYTNGQFPNAKRISYGDLKSQFGNGCGYLRFDFNPTVQNNMDISFTHSEKHEQYLSCYSVALFKRIQQLNNLTDADELEFVKSKKLMGTIENYRIIFKVEKEGQATYYDISENPKFRL